MASEFRAVGSLSLLYAFRMLGLFMVLPVLVLYASDYPGASPLTLGLALGVYGLTQALFQIPLGLLSDFVGRKPVIIAGLGVFALGSFVAGVADNMLWLIIGRALQGSGAIASTIMAMVADLTSEQTRTRAMAIIGASIGLSFTLAMVAGPALAAAGGLPTVFWAAAGLAVIGVVVLVVLVPSPPRSALSHRDTGAVPELLGRTLRNTELLRLDWGIFCLHAVLMACFLAVPSILEDKLGLSRDRHWQFYLPMLFASLAVVLPVIGLAEKRRQLKAVFVCAIAALAVSLGAMAFRIEGGWDFVALVLLFFIAFNLLEASLPSLVSKIAPAGSKGTAMGVYSTSQFLGAFIGGAAGGLVLDWLGMAGLFAGGALLAAIWWVVALFMRPPSYLSSLCISLPAEVGQDAAEDVRQLNGVAEVLWAEDEGLLYLKVDKAVLDQAELQALTDRVQSQTG